MAVISNDDAPRLSPSDDAHVVDLEERALARRERSDKIGAWLLPVA
jgi:hypothetical protein